MTRPLFSHTTVPFNAGPQGPELDLRIDALRLAVDVHLATLQLPEHERAYLGEQMHTTARSIARRLSRARVHGISPSISRCERAAARLVYLLRLARDLAWLPSAVAGVLEERAQTLRARLAREPAALAAERLHLADTPTREVSIDALATVALVARRAPALERSPARAARHP